MSESVVLGRDTKTGELVQLANDARRQGLYVIGRNGTGKTTLLLNLIVQDMKAGLGLCVLDPHGDLTRDILARVPKEREQDIILLNPLDADYPFGLNLFECADPKNPILAARTCSQVMQVFKKMWGPDSPNPSWGPQLEDLLRNAVITLIANQGYTLAELPMLLEKPDFRGRLLGNLGNDQVRNFWRETYNPMNPTDQREYRMSTLNKVREFLIQPIAECIVGQSKSTVDFRAAMDQGKIVLAPLPAGLLGDDLVTLLGSLIVGRVLNAALSRISVPESQRRPFHLYADEYHRFAVSDFAVLLAEARKFAVGTTVAHQWRDQLDSANRGATLNAANLVVFRVWGANDAQELAAEFDHTPPEPPIIGYRPVRTISETPADDLLTKGHPDPQVSDIINFHLKPLRTTLDKASRSEFNVISVSIRGWSFACHQDNLKEALVLINDYLAAIMDMQIYPGTAFEAEHLAHIIYALRAYLTLVPDHSLEYSDYIFPKKPRVIAARPSPPSWRVAEEIINFAASACKSSVIGDYGMEDLWRQLEHALANNHAGSSSFVAIDVDVSDLQVPSLSEEDLRSITEGIDRYLKGEDERHVKREPGRFDIYRRNFYDDMAHANEIARRRHEKPGPNYTYHELERMVTEKYANYKKNIAEWNGRVDQYWRERDTERQHHIEQSILIHQRLCVFAKLRVKRVQDFLCALMTLGRLLGKEPILSDSAKLEPIYDRPRTYADVQDEIASALANLPNRRARCKIVQGQMLSEHTIETLAPDRPRGEGVPELALMPPGTDPGSRLQRIVERSRANYAKSRELVAAEIAARQGKGDSGPVLPRRSD
jgi:hypothetical protein